MVWTIAHLHKYGDHFRVQMLCKEEVLAEGCVSVFVQVVDPQLDVLVKHFFGVDWHGREHQVPLPARHLLRNSFHLNIKVFKETHGLE